MQPRIEKLREKKLVGQKLTMSVTNNRTKELWSAFIPRKKVVMGKVRAELFSLQVYDSAYFEKFNPDHEFEKWAAVEVIDYTSVPQGMETISLKGGLYAVFDYKGSSTDNNVFQYIYGEWLPKSGYSLDHRPHFEVLGDKYQNSHPDSEEEIWIPIKVN